MKKTAYFFVSLLFVIASCSKSKSNGPIAEDPGCISRDIPDWQSSPLSPSDYALAVHLFQQNGLSYDKLLFTSHIRYDTVVLAGVENYEVDIIVEQFLNGLPVFEPVYGFHFKNGLFNFSDSIKITSTNLDTVAILKPSQVRTLFVGQIQKDPSSLIRQYADSCFITTFGYYSLNAGSNQPANLVKAWMVRPVGNDYPIAYFKDDGSLIYYFNGFVTL